VLSKLIASLRPAHFRSSHALFGLSHCGRSSRTLMIACSDLAADPFDLIPTNFRHLYVLQNFGNLAPPPDPQLENANDVESAVALYEARDIIVCGHSHCGVIETLLSSDKNEIPSPFAVSLRPARKTMQIVAAHCGGLRREQLLLEAARVNVLVQLENLSVIPSITARLDDGDLHLHGWLYSGGVITAYDPHRAEFVDLAQ
jgi:carbonic anhydrase